MRLYRLFDFTFTISILCALGWTSAINKEPDVQGIRKKIEQKISALQPILHSVRKICGKTQAEGKPEKPMNHWLPISSL